MQHHALTAPGPEPHRDLAVTAGLLVVGLAAATLTATTLRDLALDVGIDDPLAWLVPITVDAAGVVAARVWLLARASGPAVRFARALTWAAIVASVAGNAGQHGMEAYAVTPPWWVVVLVSAIPPATLGAVVHLAHLVSRQPDPVESPADAEMSSSAIDDEIARLMDRDAPRPTYAQIRQSYPDARPLDGNDAAGPGDVVMYDEVQAADLLDSGAGRTVLMRELGVKDHVAKKLLARHRAGLTA